MVAVVQSHPATGMACHDEVVLRQRFCRWCQAVFWICPHCDRGQRYCSLSCRTQARRQQRRSANRRYQQSPEGRQDHRDRQRQYRYRRRIGTGVTDQGSPSIPLPGKMPAWDARLTRTAVPVASTAVSVQEPVLVARRRCRTRPQPPFLACAWCGRPGRFVDPFPPIP
jgi:hypothetical protein